jgi:excisionase family DNA binding protein
MNTSDFLPLDALAARLGLPRTFLREQVKRRTIPVLRIGTRLRFDETAVRDALRRLAEKETEPRKAVAHGR